MPKKIAACAAGVALGIYRGQRGRMQIEVTVTGRSCHGSMPSEGLNPLEFGAAILDEHQALGNVGGYAEINTYSARLSEYYDDSEGRAVSTGSLRWVFA